MSPASRELRPSDRAVEPESIDSLIDRFEDLWVQGQRPALDTFLAAAGDQRRQLLVELVHVELELRLKAGEAARVEEYLQRFQDLAGDAAVEWDLIVAEHRLRARREPGLSLAEYLHRFPHRQTELSQWQPAPRNDAPATMQPAPTPPLAAPSAVSARWPTVPGYEILGELGRGGMGTVYRAWQPSLKRVVALKVLRAGAGREEHDRFRVEAEAVARLHHPGIVQIYEISEAEGQPYLTLESIAGGSLSKRLDGSPWPAGKAAALVRALAEAIHHAHQQGVVHRDLKPGKVLLGADDQPLIGDFGLAKLLLADSDQQTRTGAVLGTPCYMAPEQARGLVREIGPATDIYSLGAILYELLTGRPPFRGESTEQTMQLVRSEEPVAPCRLQPRIGRDLETVCLKCLRKKPVERYESAAALADDLRRHLDGEPVRARPPSVWRRGAAWARRRPLVTVLLLAGILLLAAVVAGLSWHTAQLSAAVDQATQEIRRLADANELRARQADYAAQMRLAHQSLRLGDLAVLPDLLDRFHPTTRASLDLRGFEWQYLAPHRRPVPQGFRAYKSYVYWLEYSPDGRLLVTAGVGSGEDSVKLWDARPGTLRFCVSPSPPQPSWIPPAAFGGGASPWLAVRDGNAVTRWDLQSGKPLPRRLATNSAVFAVAAHADGRRLFVGSAGRVGLWDADKCTLLALFPESSKGAERLCLVGNGGTLVTTQAGGPLQFWEIGSCELRRQSPSPPGAGGLAGFPRSPILVQLSRALPRLLADCGHQEVFWDWTNRVSAPITAAAVSSGEELLATGHADGVVCFWEIPMRAYRGQLRWQAVEIGALAFSPDGTTLAAGTRDGFVYQLSPPIRQEPDPLRPALIPCGEGAFSPDGKSFAVPCADRTVKLIDIGSGEARTVLRNFRNPVPALAFASDGRTLATREWGTDSVALWDITSGQQKARVQGGRDCFVFAPTGCLLALGHDGIALADSAGAPRGAGRRPGTTMIALAFSADGRTLASTDGSPNVELWDVSSGRLPSFPTVRHRLEGPVRSLAFLPDGTLVSGETTGAVRFWRPAGTGLTAVRAPLRCPDAVTRLAVSRDGKILLGHVPAHDIRCWDMTTHKLRTTLHHATGERGWSSLAPDPDRFAFLGKEGQVEFWQCKTATAGLPAGQPLWAVSALAFTADGQTLLTASRRPERTSRSPSFGGVADARGWQGTADSLRCWDPDTGKERCGLSGPLTLAPPELLALAPDGRILAAGAVDGSVWLWDRRQGGPPLRRLFVSARAQRYALKIMEPIRRQLHTGNPLYSRDSESVQALAFSQDGRWLTAAGSRGTVTVWENGEEWRQVRRFSLGAVGAAWVAFSPSGNLVVPQGGQLRFLDGEATRFVLGRQQEAPAVCVGFAREGNLLAVAHQDRRIRLWDLTKKEPAGELIGHLDQVTALAFAPDGKTLASASHDRTVRLWSVAALVEVASLEQHRGKVFCLAFSPDGTTLASGGEGQAGQGEVYLWRAPRR